MLKEYLKLLRIKHYIKNGLIFLPLIFSYHLFDVSFFYVLGGFVAFSCCSSIVYIINDLHDVEKDRLHPTKKFRPIASGVISATNAKIVLGMLCILATICIYLLSAYAKTAWVFPLAYVFLNYLYSKALKNVAILDVFILGTGYVLRVFYGAALANVTVSSWLYLTVLVMALYLGLGKRRNEIMQNGSQTRKVLKMYNQDFLDKNMSHCLTMAIVFYSLWTMQNTNGPFIFISIPLVIFICMRYSLLMENESDGDPTEVIFRDKPIMVLIAIYVVLICLLYFFKP